MESRSRLIVLYQHGKVIDAFGSIEEASAVTGIKPLIIKRMLKGMYPETKQGYILKWEIKASDLHKETLKKEKEKHERNFS